MDSLGTCVCNGYEAFPGYKQYKQVFDKYFAVVSTQAEGETQSTSPHSCSLFHKKIQFSFYQITMHMKV